MNFFQSQDAARKNTKLLVILFIAAVLILVAMTNLLVIGFAAFSQSPTITTTELKNQFDWEMFLLVGAGVVTLILIASIYKIIQLSGGGARVAEMMDAELIIDDQGDLYKRRVLNVVEEMAIASGNPVPPFTSCKTMPSMHSLQAPQQAMPLSVLPPERYKNLPVNNCKA